jgi:hypothetical protein
MTILSNLSNLTSTLGPIPIPLPIEECKPAKSEECRDEKKSHEESKYEDHDKQAKSDDCEKQAKSDDRREDHDKQAKYDDHEKQAKSDDCEKQAKYEDHREDHDKQAKYDDHDKQAKSDDGEKQAKYEDHREDHDKQAKYDDHEKQTKSDDCEKQPKYDDHKEAKNDDCHSYKDDCQVKQVVWDSKSSDDCGKCDTHYNPGEALAKLDFSHGDLSSQNVDHTGDMQSALATMSSGHALDYAIGQMGSPDHLDVTHFDHPADLTSHDAHHVV